MIRSTSPSASSWKCKLLWIPAVLLLGLIPGLLIPWVLEQETINAVDELLTRARQGDQEAISRSVLREYAPKNTEEALRALSTSTNHLMPFFFWKSWPYICFVVSLDTPSGTRPLSIITYNNNGAPKIYAMSTTRGCGCNAKITFTPSCSLY
jgi:hypothetical protein